MPVLTVPYLHERTHIFVFNHNLCGRQRHQLVKPTQQCIQRGHVTVKGCSEEKGREGREGWGKKEAQVEALVFCSADSNTNKNEGVFFFSPQIHADRVDRSCCFCPFPLTAAQQSCLYELHVSHKENIKQHLHHYITTVSNIIQGVCCKCSVLMCIQDQINHQNILRLFLFTADFDKEVSCSK